MDKLGKEKLPNKSSRLLRWLLFILLFLILFPILVFFLLQVNTVQNKLAEAITQRISTNIKGDVDFGHIDLSISDGLQLEDFILKGETGDTIISAASLDVGLKKSLFSLFDKSVAVGNIKLDRPVVRIITRKGEQANSLNKILDVFKSDKPKSSGGEKLAFDIKEVDVLNLSVYIRDENKNSEQSIEVARSTIILNKLFEDDMLDIEKLILDRPVIRIRKSTEGEQVSIQGEELKEAIEKVKNDSSSLVIKLKELELIDGIFALDDDRKKASIYTDVLDMSHFEFSEINLKTKNLLVENGSDFALDLELLSFVDDKGFRVKSVSSDNVVVNNQTISLPSFSFQSDRTRIDEAISLKFNSFEDFKDFEKLVEIRADLKNSRVHFADVMHFVAKLNKSKFFINNKYRTVNLNGVLSGKVDNLKGNNMKIGIGDDLQLDASFSTRKLTVKNGEFIDIRMKNLDTNIDFLKSFIPGFTPPENFDKLGTINFAGSFYGYLKDFVVFGGLQSEMGDAFLDMRLDVKDGNDLAKYSGELSVEQFQLGRWTDNYDFGLVDFSASIEDGKGLTLESVYSDLYATVESLTFKEYEYRDFIMDAQVDKNKFNGEFSITDENIDFVFDGNIEVKDGVPYLDFKSNIEQIDFQKLNLTKSPYVIKGNIDINGYGNDVNDVIGEMIASDIYIVANDTIYQMDTISLKATDYSPTDRHIDLFSDIASVELEGQYDLKTIIPTAKKLLKQNYPHFTQGWKVDNNIYADQKLRFDISIFESKNFLDLVGIENFDTKNLKAKGSLDSRKGDLSFASSIPFLSISENNFYDTQLLISSDNKSGDILINVDSTVVGGQSFNPIDFQSRMKGDTINFLVSTTEIVDSLESLDIQGRLVPHPQGYQLNITDNKIEALGSIWSFDNANKIVLGTNYHKIDNLRLTDGKRSITIDDVKNKGIALYLADFDFLTLNGIIDYDKMIFAGEGDVSLFVDDIYENKNLSANIYIQDFTINDDSYGTLEIDVNKDEGNPAAMLFSLGDLEKELLVNATFDPEKNNFLDAKVQSKKFPLKIFEYLLKDGIKNTEGGVDLKATVSGPVSDLKIDGTGYLTGGVTIIYTGVEYKFDKQEVKVTENIIDLTGAIITDPEYGEGLITGGLNHYLFKDFTLDATISGTDVVALNTTKYENPLYYGYGKGDMSVKFTGPFHLVNMKINASAKEGSVLNIPIWEGETSTDKNFIKFINKEELLAKETSEAESFRFEGLDIEINLSMTPEARVNIIFDESRGDIIQGNGRGNMKMNITRYGDFDMYGTYDIERGEYLFTALGAVAKPFQVRRGGQIRWTGDPVNAELDIVADYEVRTPMEVFLSEFTVENPNLQAASRSKTKVELILNLGGTLYSPMVNFDLDFPDVQGELRSVVQSKMRTLNANQAELNSQVLGLIVFNSFLPSNSSQIALGGSDIGNAGIGTLSEFVSSQLSLLFTGLLNEVFADNDIISGIDFDIGFRKNSFNGVQNNNGDIAPDEYEARVKSRFKFLDERLSLDLGGNYVRENVLNGGVIGDYFIGDFIIEYFLTDDRKLKLRMYGQYDYDEISIARRQKYGLGIGYRTEFGTLSDFKNTMAEQFREIETEKEGIQE